MKRKITIFTCCLVLVFSFAFTGYNNDVHAQERYVYKWINISKVEITAYKLNVRTGPSTAFPIINYVSRGDKIEVIGALAGWYVVHLPDNSVGVLSSTYTRPYKYHNPPANTSKPAPFVPSKPTPEATNLSTDEQKMVDLINAERLKNGLSSLKLDSSLAKVARTKAQDMADNSYFSHSSPTYGTPFEMLKKFGITYTAAGENIAGNSTVEKAQTALLNSPGHRANILSKNYNTVGIGIVSDRRYGKVFVQLFIKK